MDSTRKISTLFVITMNSKIRVRCYNGIPFKSHAKPNLRPHLVRYNRVFTVTVIVTAEFDCTLIPNTALVYITLFFRSPLSGLLSI
jgi:hypothetical protein